MGENNNKPIGFIQINRPYADSRSALRGSSFTGKSGAYERSLEVAEILHMGVTDRKFGLFRPRAARRFRESERMFASAAF